MAADDVTLAVKFANLHGESLLLIDLISRDKEMPSPAVTLHKRGGLSSAVAGSALGIVERGSFKTYLCLATQEY